MTPDRAIERLRAYEAELQSIHSRFRHTHNAIHIADGDEGRLQQIVIEMRDLFDDLLGQNSYSTMMVNAFNEGVGNYLSSPSLLSVQRIIGIVSAAITRIQENPGIVAKSEKENPAEPIATQDPLQMPDKVTLQWLYKNVPYSLWVGFAGALMAAFALGVAVVVKLSVVQQWFGVLCVVQP